MRVPFLDSLRGIAIVAVFLFHCFGMAFPMDVLPWKGWTRDLNAPAGFLAAYPMTYGFAGVALFFVISGFCIHTSHISAQPERWSRFFARRFFRIFPPYILAALLFLSLSMLKNPDVALANRGIQLVSHTFLVHNLHPFTIFGINASFWSIAVEAQLYLLYPVMCWLVRGLGWRGALILIGAIEVCIRLGVSVDLAPFWLRTSPFSFWLGWSLGACLADAHARGAGTWLRRCPMWPLAIAALGSHWFHLTEPFSFLLFAVWSAWVIDHLLDQKWPATETGVVGTVWRHLAYIGVASYSVYLLHLPILHFSRLCFSRMIQSWNIQVEPLLMLPLYAAMWVPILLVSWCCYRWIELPSANHGKSILNRA